MSNIEPPEAYGTFNAAHGFRRLRFADLQVDHNYVLKTIEKYTQDNKITILTYYYFVRIVDKTEDAVKYHSYYSAVEGYPWNAVEPDPDDEDWPVTELTREQVNTIVTTDTGFSTSEMLHHFYEPEPSNAVSVASTTFNNNSVNSDPMPMNLNNNASSVASNPQSTGGKRRRTKRVNRRRRKTRHRRR